MSLIYLNSRGNKPHSLASEKTYPASPDAFTKIGSETPDDVSRHKIKRTHCDGPDTPSKQTWVWTTYFPHGEHGDEPDRRCLKQEFDFFHMTIQNRQTY